jgi:hypothetical protein
MEGGQAMKVAAAICLLFACLGFLSAVGTVMHGPNKPEQAEHFIGYCVGAFLGPLMVAVLGLWLWGHAEKKAASNQVVEAEIVDEPPQNPFA